MVFSLQTIKRWFEKSICCLGNARQVTINLPATVATFCCMAKIDHIVYGKKYNMASMMPRFPTNTVDQYPNLNPHL